MVRHADARAAAAGQRYGSRMPRNEMIVVPHGVEHCPDVPEGEAHVLLIERAGTPNTGSAGGERAVEPVPLEQS